VGDKIREIFHKANVGIRVYDPVTNMLHYPYYVENGKRITFDSQLVGDKGFGAHVLRTRQTLVVNENMAEEMAKYGSINMPGTGMSRSIAMVPLIVGGQAKGIINLVDNDREHAYTESDIRLLETLAGTMSVALENARLFDEMQRFYKESEERAAELAIINSVQRALAAELNIQGIYDAVGEKIREIFRGADVGIRIIDPKSGMIHFPFAYEQGRRVPIDPIRLQGFTAHVVRTREVLVINENMAAEMKKHGSSVLPGTELPKAQMFVPLFTGDQVRGALYVQDLEHEN